jgi:two-component system, LytTR family, response regulator
LAGIRKHTPALVFLDVQMPELDGFEVLEELEPNIRPAVIFVTAYDAFALRAFEVHAVDYLLKPFTRARFESAMNHVLQRLATPTRGSDDHVRALLDAIRAERQADRVAIRTEQGVYFVRIEELDWIEADGNYLKLHGGAQSHTLRETLKNFERRLDPARFLRVHRSVIVNIDSIQRLEPWFHGEYVIVLRDGKKLMSSRTYSHRLQAVLR